MQNPYDPTDDDLVARLKPLAAQLPGAPADITSRFWLQVGHVSHATLASHGEAFELPQRVSLDGVVYRIGWAKSAPYAAYARIAAQG